MDNIIINLDDGLRLGGDTLPNITPQSDIISQSDAIVGPAGPQGPQGPAGADGEAATITVGSTTTGAAGTNAVVQNSGTSSAAILDFVIPRGDKGETGEQGPQGETGAAGADGEAATITVGSVTTVSSEYPATVTNSGTSSAAVLDFQIPQGIQGETGPAGADGRDGTDGRDGVDGAAATITVGSTTTGAAGTNASVTNSGTSSAAIFDFTIPRGADGSIEELTSVPKFNAYYNTTYSNFPADTPIPYNTAAVNIGSFTLSSGQVTIPKTGNYLITIQLWVLNNGSRSWWRLRRNGNTIGESIISATGYWGLTAISNIYPCTQGDVIDVIKNGSESVNLNSGSADKRTTSISIQYIG